MAGQRALASGSRGALPLVGGICWGATTGKANHNTSNARDVTAGKMGRNSSTGNAACWQNFVSMSVTHSCQHGLIKLRESA